MKRRLLAAAMVCLSATFAQADNYYTDVIYTGGKYHLGPQDLYQRQARVLQSHRPGYFRVLVTPNLVPRAAAMVVAVGAGRAQCARLGKTGLGLQKIQRHADQDISAWGMDFSCR